jgi:starvation-inducible DNA-binding protein
MSESDAAATTEVGGYRLQLTLVDLIDLTLQTQHVRWNLVDEESLRMQLNDFDALVRAGSDAVAGRLRELGVPPDGRIGTAYQDLLFEPLPPGPLDASRALTAFSHRLTQFGSRMSESMQILERSDPESHGVLLALHGEITQWTDRLAVGS